MGTWRSSACRHFRPHTVHILTHYRYLLNNRILINSIILTLINHELTKLGVIDFIVTFETTRRSWLFAIWLASITRICSWDLLYHTAALWILILLLLMMLGSYFYPFTVLWISLYQISTTTLLIWDWKRGLASLGWDFVTIPLIHILKFKLFI